MNAFLFPCRDGACPVSTATLTGMIEFVFASQRLAFSFDEGRAFAEQGLLIVFVIILSLIFTRNSIFVICVTTTTLNPQQPRIL